MDAGDDVNNKNAGDIPALDISESCTKKEEDHSEIMHMLCRGRASTASSIPKVEFHKA